MISVLYVDDDEAFCRLSKIYLKKMGEFEVTTVGSACEAIDMVLSGRYDIVISDYQMPGMNGIEFLKEYRKKGGTTPFILFTGKGREEVVIEAINNGAAFYLQKGSDPRSLFAELAHKILQSVAREVAEKQLKESEEKFRTLFESARDGIILVYDEKILECNPYAVHLFGTRREDLIGSSFYQWSPNLQNDGRSTREAGDATFISALKEGGVFKRWLFIRADKSEFNAEISVNTLEIRGRIILQAVIRDISDRLKAEEEIARRNTDLSAAYEELMASGEELEKGLDDLKRSQEALKESEERYRNLADLLPGGVFECTQEGRITYINHEAYVMFGYEPDTDISGFSVLQFIHPDEHERVLNILHSPQDSVTGHQYYAVRKDGSLFPAIIRASLSIQDGKFTGLRGIIIDISEQKKAEAALKESKQRLTDVIEFLPDAILVINKDGKVISWNRAISELTGISADDMMGKDNYEYALPFYGYRRPILVDLALHPDLSDEIKYYFIAHEGDVIIGETYAPVMKSGSNYLWGKAAPLRDAAGEIVGAIESIRDVTRWKEAELVLTQAHDELEQKILDRTEELTRLNKALGESEERYRSLIELSPDTILVHDGKQIKFINHAGTSLLGAADKDELIGRAILDIIHPGCKNLVSSRIERIMKGDKNLYSEEERFIGLSGNIIPVEVSTMRIMYGGRSSILVIARDISLRKESEYKLKEYAAALEDKNRELDFLTNRLISLNRDLDERVKRRTEEVNILLKQKDEFINRLGHDLKTPLTPLIALLPDLLEKETDPDVSKALSVLLRSVYSIRDQTEKILTLARLTKDEITMDIGLLHPAEFVRRAIENNWLFIKNKDINLINDLPDDLTIWFSEQDLTSVIENLLSNAIKYTATGGSIRIFYKKTDGMILISVEDTGIGLSEEEAEHVFDEFYMADNSRHDRQSSGLGLTIVKRIMEYYNGRVFVESQGKGMGSRFTLCIPVLNGRSDLPKVI